MKRLAILVALGLFAAALIHARGEAAPRPVIPDRGVPAVTVPVGTGAVSRLTATMRRSIEKAIAAAADDGIDLHVTSGWRSAAHQQRLYDDAVAKYGSPEVARQWVLPPAESAHVRGEAVDVGPVEAAAWLERHGERFGLCRRYANEPWHFERLAGAKGSRCPTLEAHP
jgi:D-alanyl-D-alanine carboxypeptidase